MSIVKLAPETWLHIAHHLESRPSVAALAQVNRKLNGIFQPELFREAVQEGGRDLIVAAASAGNLATLKLARSFSADIKKTYSIPAPTWVLERWGWGDGSDAALLSKVCWATPLHLAVKHGHYHVVQWLLQQNVDMEMPGTGSLTCHFTPPWTPLHLGICNHRASVVRLLLSAGASQDVMVHSASPKFPRPSPSQIILYGPLSAEGNAENQQEPPLLEMDDMPPVAAIHTAVAAGAKSIMTHLVRDLGVDIDTREGRYGATPLHYAIASRDVSVMTHVLSLGANPRIVDINHTNQEVICKDAVDFALYADNNDAAMHLLEYEGFAWYHQAGEESPKEAKIKEIFASSRDFDQTPGCIAIMPLYLPQILRSVLQVTQQTHKPEYAPLHQELNNAFLFACQAHARQPEDFDFDCFTVEHQMLGHFLDAAVDLCDIMSHRPDPGLFQYPRLDRPGLPDIALEDELSGLGHSTLGMLALYVTVDAMMFDHGRQTLATLRWLVAHGARPTTVPGGDARLTPLYNLLDRLKRLDRDGISESQILDLVAIIKLLGDNGAWQPLGGANHEAMNVMLSEYSEAVCCMSRHWRRQTAEFRKQILIGLPPEVLDAVDMAIFAPKNQ
ncbi:hypothetical protein EsH8_VI_000288 [Colletotrichum jinshuiense]